MISDESSDNTFYKQIAEKRAEDVKRGITTSLLDASRNKTCHHHDNMNFDLNELTCLMPHYSTKLNVDNYL